MSIPRVNYTTFLSHFNYGEKVLMDDHKDIVGTIVSFWFKDHDICNIEVSWFHNGELRYGWFAHYRLTLIAK